MHLHQLRLQPLLPVTRDQHQDQIRFQKGIDRQAVPSIRRIVLRHQFRIERPVIHEQIQKLFRCSNPIREPFEGLIHMKYSVHLNMKSPD